MTRFQRNLVLALCLVWVVLLLYGLRRTLNNGEWVTHSQDIEQAILQTLSGVQEAESAKRGFLLTQKTHFLATYHTSQMRYQSYMVTLTNLVKDNPVQKNNLQILRTVADRKVKEMDSVLSVALNGDLTEALRRMNTSENIVLMDQVREAAISMANSERDILRDRQNAFKSSGEWLFNNFLLSFCLQAILIGFGTAPRPQTALPSDNPPTQP
jgi:CHASE3 domain sensor protein